MKPIPQNIAEPILIPAFLFSLLNLFFVSFVSFVVHLPFAFFAAFARPWPGAVEMDLQPSRFALWWTGPARRRQHTLVPSHS
jgi:hypothetical protein